MLAEGTDKKRPRLLLTFEDQPSGLTAEVLLPARTSCRVRFFWTRDSPSAVTHPLERRYDWHLTTILARRSRRERQLTSGSRDEERAARKQGR